MGGAFDPAYALAATGALAWAAALAAAAAPAGAGRQGRGDASADDHTGHAPSGRAEARIWAAAFAALALHWVAGLIGGSGLPPAVAQAADGLAAAAPIVAALLILYGLYLGALHAADAAFVSRFGRYGPAVPLGLAGAAALPLVAGAVGVLPAATGLFADAVAGVMLAGGGVLAASRAGPLHPPAGRLVALAVAAFGLVWLAGAVGLPLRPAGVPVRPVAMLALGTVLAAAVVSAGQGALASSLGAARRALAESAEAQERRALARAKTEFLASISHELRTPLNAIIGFSEIIRDRHFGPDATDRYAECAGDIHTSGTHLMGVLDDVLEMSRIEGGRYCLRRESVMIGDLAEACRRIVDGPAAERDIVVDLAIDPAVGPIDADPRALKQILINLLTNAVKFTPRGGRVTAFARPGPIDASAGGLVFGVRDTGIGIPPSDIPLVREPFRQGTTRPDTSVAEGTGLGLAIVDRLVALHDGRLTIDSIVDRGTTVTVHLPAPATAPATGATAPAARSA